MSKTNKDNILYHIDCFHEHNIYLPTRSIYFGSHLESEEDIVLCRNTAQIIKNLLILEKEEIAPISITLNTCGGSWDDGIAIYDIIRALKSEVTIIGVGKVYSMGSIIIQAADVRVLTENTTFMIHDGTDGYIGDAKAFENWAEQSKKTRQKMYKIYYDNMYKKNKLITLKQVEKMCAQDNILNAKEAKDLGLVDKIIKKVIK
ncbi:MAG: ATP-dependent Clp protease proteolytic subunit [Novosphingobium sp.]|nr:ATP-dependent Clp protease proteolytic subunit [Novosphingobium sp.]